MKIYFRRLSLVLAVLMSLMSIAVGCGDDHTGGAGGNDLAALEGVWFGFSIFGGNVALIIDDSGNLTGSLSDGVPTGVTGTFARLDDEIFSLTVPGGESFFFTDDAFEHGLLLAGISLVTAQKDPSMEPAGFAENDVIGSWLGYGYAYDDVAGAYGKVAPVQVVASLGVPSLTRAFEVTLPDGATIDGTITEFDAETGIWQGVTNTGAGVVIAMTVDKAFVGVATGSASASQNLTYFALNKQ